MGRVPHGLKLRPPRAAEGERLREIAIAAKSHWGYERDQVLAWVADGDFSPAGLRAKAFVVADVAGTAIAFASLVERGESWILDDLWVDPAWIGRGVGTKLFEECAERARRGGASRLEWEAEPNAVGFYERLGAKHLGESEPTSFGRTVPVMGVEL